jgi:hypothetical protein
VNCAHACNSTTVLKKCKSPPYQHSKTGLSCDDLFGSVGSVGLGSCRLYNISIGKEITDGYPKGPLLYKSEVCDGLGDSSLNIPDKIGIAFGVLSFIVGVIGIIKWKIIKRYFRNFRNSRRQQQ